ncbi:MAG: hypothetical protein H0V00_11845 [Chloroflexia bacterium]|nr:hypothetical protein [Chloroflexia bacterium]
MALDSGEINAVRITGDGRTVVFRIYRDTTIRNTSPSQPIARGIWVINADGSGMRQLVGPAEMGALLGVTPEEAPFFGGSSGLDSSANGAQIVFTSLTADVDPATGGGVREALFAVNADGAGLRRLLGPTSTFVQANAISGDGATVAYVTLDFGTGLQEAGVIGFDGGGQRALTDSTSIHPGTGANLPSGERIQLSQDGSRLLLGSTGLLYDTASGDVLALGIGTPGFSTDPTPLVSDGLYRATMNAEATRMLSLFQPLGEPYQLSRLDLNPTELGGAPSVTDASLTPAFILTEGRSTALVSARVSTTTASIVRVSSRVLREALPDDNTRTSPLLDDGASATDATTGDVTAGDGLFTSAGIYTDCCAEVGPRTVRIKAEAQAADGLRHATAIDAGPFQVSTEPVEGGPPPATAIATALPVTPAPMTPPSGGDAAALATIAAQATRIAELEAPSRATPPVVTTPPGALITPTVPPPDIAASPPAGIGTPSPADFLIPDPSECTITPRGLDAIQALAATPDVAASDVLLSAMVTPGLDIPAGQPVDAATAEAIRVTYRQMTACFNAGSDLAAYALWTDDALRQIRVQPPETDAVNPIPAEKQTAVRVTEIRLLPDGRLAAMREERSAGATTAIVQVLVRQDDRYLIDETLDLASG